MNIVNWIIANVSTVIVGIMVAVMVILALRNIIRGWRKGGCGCSWSGCQGNCSHCSIPGNAWKRGGKSNEETDLHRD